MCLDTWSPAGGAILGGETFRSWDLDVGSRSLRGWSGDRLVLVQSSPSSSSGPSSPVSGPLQP